jgi:hypothetical protein
MATGAPAPLVIEAADAGSSLLLDALETYGCALVREALPPVLLEAVGRRANAHFFRASFLQTSAELAVLDAVPVLALGTVRHPDLGTSADLVAALAESKPWRALRALYPELCVAATQSRLRLARPSDDPNGGFQQWAGSDRQRSLGFGFWIPLSPCGEEAPSIELVARRASTPLPIREGGVPLAELPAAQRNALWTPEFGLGDLVIFDPLTPHRDAVRRDMRQARIAVECRVLRRPPEKAG